MKKLRRPRTTCFTFIEIMLVAITATTLLGKILPHIRSKQAEGHLARVDDALTTLKNAILAYQRAHANASPENITLDLVNATPPLLASPMVDPFQTDGTTYGYERGTDPAFGSWFAVYSKGPKGDTNSVAWESTNHRLRYAGSGRVVSNAPVVKD